VGAVGLSKGVGELKLGRNELCWCGSGKKFKHCHLGREGERPLHPAEIDRIILEPLKKGCCLHPEAGRGVCGKIIDAHTIPRSKVLSKIADESNHVLSFHPFRIVDLGEDGPRRVGWKRASTFRGFCDRHDGATFRAVENEPFSASPEQCFLLAYRALCYELFTKKRNLEAVSKLRQVLDRGKPYEEQVRIQNYLACYEEGLCLGLRDAQHWKNFADESLMAQQFQNWNHCVLRFRGTWCVASTGMATPDFDLKGRKLQNLEDLDVVIEPLMFNMMPIDSNGFAAIFSWPATTSSGRRFIESLIDRNDVGEAIPQAVVRFMFGWIENTYFSPRWWENLEDTVRYVIAELAMAYPPTPELLRPNDHPLVDWELVSTQWV